MKHYTRERELIELFEINTNQINRMFPSDTKWIIISDNEDFNKKFETTLRTTKINGVI